MCVSGAFFLRSALPGTREGDDDIGGSFLNEQRGGVVCVVRRCLFSLSVGLFRLFLFPLTPQRASRGRPGPPSEDSGGSCGGFAVFAAAAEDDDESRHFFSLIISRRGGASAGGGRWWWRRRWRR